MPIHEQMLRRDKTPLHEQLLAQGTPEASPSREVAAPATPGRGRRRAIAIGLAVSSALLALHFLVYIPVIGIWLAPAAIIGLNLWLRWKRRGLAPARRSLIAGGVRRVFLVWCAVAPATLVLVALGGFQRDDRILLLVVFLILATLGAGQAAVARRR